MDLASNLVRAITLCFAVLRKSGPLQHSNGLAQEVLYLICRHRRLVELSSNAAGLPAQAAQRAIAPKDVLALLLATPATTQDRQLHYADSRLVPKQLQVEQF